MNPRQLVVCLPNLSVRDLLPFHRADAYEAQLLKRPSSGVGAAAAQAGAAAAAALRAATGATTKPALRALSLPLLLTLCLLLLTLLRFFSLSGTFFPQLS